MLITPHPDNVKTSKNRYSRETKPEKNERFKKPKKQNQAGMEIPTEAIADVDLTSWSNPSDDVDNELTANPNEMKCLAH